MQKLYVDLPAGLLSKLSKTEYPIKQGLTQIRPLRQQGYDRMLLQAEDSTTLLDRLETITFQHSFLWMLQEGKKQYRYLLDPQSYLLFQEQAQKRIQRMEGQLRAVIRQDLEQLLPQAVCFNVQGYLRFTARKLKRLLRKLLREEYRRLEAELEQEEFIELLRFFVSVQPSVIDAAYLTFYGEQFTLTDEWGNDLRQIYLDSLREEEIFDVSNNDLIMSILITLLPEKIYLEIEEAPPNLEFLMLLQQVFAEQLVDNSTDF